MTSLSIGTLTPPVLFGRASQKAGWDHTGRELSTHLFVFFMGGEAEFRIGSTSVTARRGDAVFIPAGTFYVPHTASCTDYYFFHFNAKPCASSEGHEGTVPSFSAPYFVLVPEAPGEALSLPLFMPSGAHSAEIEQSLFRCERLLSERGNEARLLFAIELFRVLALSARGAEKAVPAALSAMGAYLSERMREEVSLSELARVFGYSPSYVARLFRVHLGTTVSAYRNDLRLTHAYRLLLDTDLRVGEIAEACGFSDIYYFSRLVKRRFGMSPMGLRASRSAAVGGV